MSPIYETKRDSKSAKIREDGLNWSLLLAFLMVFIPIFLVEIMGASFLLFWLLAPFAGFGNLVGRMQQSSYVSNFNSEYEEINNQYIRIIKNKKLLKDKEVDKIAKSLTSDNFSYSDVLTILVYFEDLDNHKKQLKNKKIKISHDEKINLKSGEKLLFKTHAKWCQGAPEAYNYKDIGFFYLTNKRIIFLGEIRSYSTNFSRVTRAETGVDYFLLQKTAGPNDIYIINSEDSIDCLAKNYNS